MRLENCKWERQTIFVEPNGFSVDYEEVNEVPFIHFTFHTDKITPTLIKMLKILDTEICEVLYEEGFDHLFSYTTIDNKSIIQLAKKFGYKIINRVSGQVIFCKDLKEVK